MSNESQDTRLIAVETPLGKDVLLLTAVYGEELISGLFGFQLEMLSRAASIDPKDIVGKPVDISIKLSDGGTRFINGFVSSFTSSGTEVRGLSGYRAQVVPWLWFLTRTADCRIFQKKSIPEILEEVFGDIDFAQFDDSGIDKGAYQKWDYCVQYRETDFNFVSRLMEQVGICYWFRHEKGKHTLVLADSQSAYKDCPEKEVDYAAGSLAADHIGDWQHHYELQPGKWAQTDFNFETPQANLRTSTPTLVDLPDAKKYEIFDYPGEYAKKGEGETLTKIRMEEEEADYHVVNGTSACRTFTAGHRFTLVRHDLPSEKNKSYLITRIEHNATDESYVSGSGASPADYSNSFSCIPAELIFRPARTTPKPLVQGPQTAMVVGPNGEEIYTDKYGRVKVQFHWDRYGKRNEDSSCWIRVSHPWAGKSWGAVAIPRIGQEVIVEFLEGDPDRPIITGRVYNKDTMPPYELPAGAVVSGMKSNSTKGGGGYNEISMDDTKSKEKITVHAQYDMNTTVEHDDSQTIHNNRTIKVDGTHTETITGAVTETYDNKQETTIANELVIKSTGSHVHVTAATDIKLEVGASKLLMKSTGYIEINGVDIAINGVSINVHGVSVTSQADADHNTKGAIVISEGAASNTVKGGMVMLNP